MPAARRRPQERAEGSTKQVRLTVLLCILWLSLAEHPVQLQAPSFKVLGCTDKANYGMAAPSRQLTGLSQAFTSTSESPKQSLVMLLVGGQWVPQPGLVSAWSWAGSWWWLVKGWAPVCHQNTGVLP